MASQFVRKITDTTINEPIKETTTNGDLIITKDDKVLINLNGTLKDLTPTLTGDEFNELKSSIKKNTDGITQLNEDMDSAITKAPKLDGDNTYMGINKFTDGVSLAGKNVVNGLTDTEWLDIPLAEGRTGTAKYKVSLGKVFVHIENVKGIKTTGYNEQSKIGTLPIKLKLNTLRYIIQSYNSTIVLKQVTIQSSGDIYVTNPMGNPMSEDDSYILDTVLI